MKNTYDLIIIGAGPAGIAAALEAATHGLAVLVLGEQPLPGGQIYRTVELTEPAVRQLLGPEVREGQKLVRRFREAPVEYRPGATVWQVEANSGTYSRISVNFVTDNLTRQVNGQRLLIATGARERPMPIPGWTLPGVMAATAADVMLKSHGLIPAGAIVLAGSGPLLFLTAVRLIDAGAELKALLDTSATANYFAALPYLPQALRAWQYLVKGLAFKLKIRRRGIPIYSRVRNLAAEGTDAVQSIGFRSGGKKHNIKLDTLLLHNGVVPDTQMSAQLECAHTWNPLQRYWQPELDRWGNTSLPGIAVVGDAAGIAGARAAEATGHLAALEAAGALKALSKQQRNAMAAPYQITLFRERAVRPFLDVLFRPDPSLLVPRDDHTTVCRCEELTAGDIRQALELGALGPNQLKSQTRAAMGLCQGRMCGLTIAEMIADYRCVDVSEVGLARVRPPLKPVPLQQIAAIELAKQPGPRI